MYMTTPEINLNGMSVMFEITRFCNMACPHCVRGDAQRIRIKREYISSTLRQLTQIDSMQFTGGEPALALDLIEYTLQECIWNNIEIANFWMATNGTIATPKFFNLIDRWLAYCCDNEISGLRVSIDNYHDCIDNRYKFEEFKEYSNYNFYLELSGAPSNTSYLISDGRAAWNYPATRPVEHDLHLNEDGTIEGTLYINARGYVLSTCDISYNTSDEKGSEFVVCHCTDNIQEKLEEFFEKHPELVY